ncbi:hypothetical protein F4561_005412 [Lipingzhangella halophila]|uniref:Uncharacterized protein n=1 Tax=Lipingzhangella halophila TaxID=1783352 RepID=A0A7W7RM91_9ACTN|nr:hypothetical protein [Lipingzhangella halophila]MBB4934592.1 hypothetical protein [Lipingzhangella halophila]
MTKAASFKAQNLEHLFMAALAAPNGLSLLRKFQGSVHSFNQYHGEAPATGTTEVRNRVLGVFRGPLYQKLDNPDTVRIETASLDSFLTYVASGANGKKSALDALNALRSRDGRKHYPGPGSVPRVNAAHASMVVDNLVDSLKVANSELKKVGGSRE